MTIHQNISPLYEEIRHRLNTVRKKQNSVDLITGIIISSSVLLITTLLSIILDRMFGLGVTGRTIIFIFTLLSTLAAASWFAGRPLLKIFNVLKNTADSEIALKVGKQFPHINDRLLNALQVYESKLKEKIIYSIELIDASFIDLYDTIKPIDFLRAVDRTLINKMRRVFIYTLGVFLLIVLISPKGFVWSAYRILKFNEPFSVIPKIIFMVDPGDTEVIRGVTVPITIHPAGTPVKTIIIHTREEGVTKFEKTTLKISYDGSFRFSIPNIKSNTFYFASAEDIKSPQYKILVVNRPIIRSLQLSLNYPAYTRIPPKRLEENVGDVTALPGTRISFSIISSKKLSLAELRFNDGSVTKLTLSDTEAKGNLILSKGKNYTILLKDETGLSNVDPVEYHLKIIPDEFPTASIILPGKNVDVTENLKLPLLTRIKDDFGFTRLRLAYRLVRSRYEQPAEEFSFVDISLALKDQIAQELWYEWNLTGLKLAPEDVLAYYVKVFDNDKVSGPKSGRSETYLVRLPSLDEVFADVAQSQQHTLESMQSIAKEAEQMKKELEELQREMKKNPQKMDWQQQKKAEELTKKYDEMRKKISETAQKMQEMIQKMDENKLFSNQTMEKFQEMQKLMDQLNNPELQEAMRKLQESMKQMTPEQMKQAMQQINLSEEQFRKNLERMIELLKRIAIEQKIDELIKRTEELIKQQQELQNQTAKTNPEDEKRLTDLARQQEDMQKQIDKLEQEAKSLKEKMEEFPEDMPTEKMDKAQKDLANKKLQQKAKKSAQQMKSGEMKQSNQTQQEMKEDLEDFMSQMQDVKESLQQQMQKEVLNKMRKAVQDLLELSKKQEALKQETQNLDPNSQRFRENAQQQMDMMGDLNNVANSMSEISKKSFAISPEMGKEIGNAMKQMAQSLQNMEQRNPSGASQQQSEAMSSCNRAAMMMQGAINSMKQGGGKGMGMAGLMQRLGQMSGMQMGINQQTGQAMGQGQGLTQQQMAEYARIAGQQGAARKALEQLIEEAKNAGELSKLLGDLERVVKDMIEVQTDLEQGNVNPETLKKQDRILSRLLDSQRSMRERDFEKRRRAEVGKDYKHTGPADIDLTSQDGRNKLREELLKMLEEKYSKDYEDLIRKYFEALEKERIE
ncbi:MAG: hypothetical protein KKG06_12235 [Bacteroidetes bacterium]|nr:hypothetical protein [Bacteroidota bacterium]MBU1423924.1 hypothetical protein [Bacteroidota bacterium]